MRSSPAFVAAVGAASLSGLLSISVLGMGSAAAESDARPKYSDVSSALSTAGLRVVIASVEGHDLDIGDCIVERSQSAPGQRSGQSNAATVLLYLSCRA